MAKSVVLLMRNYSKFYLIFSCYSSEMLSWLDRLSISPKFYTILGETFSRIACIIDEIVSYEKLLLGLTSSNTKGLPPFSILTSISSLPPAWNLISISSNLIWWGKKNLIIYLWTSCCRELSVNLCLLIIQGVCDRYLENLTYLPHR